MQTLSAYLPADRYRSLARGVPLRERASGAALFADISGFTPLTEALARLLGPRKGAEELTRQLNRVYDALIASIHRYGGDVISFSGDGITCWFDDADGPAAGGGERAVAAGLALLRTMELIGAVAFPDGSSTTLALKVAVASGPARRFLVGDPAIQLIDVLAGAVVTRVASGGELCGRGELLVDEATAAQLGDRLRLAGWRDDPESGERFALVAGYAGPWPEEGVGDGDAGPAVPAETLRAWLLPPIYERLRGDEGELLTELRPATALFLRFGGIDYEGDDEARTTLDRYVREVQALLARYDSFLLQLTIGDKGSYLYAAFGAPLAHEDDARRAVQAALDLRACPLTPGDGRVQIGISHGLMRAGAYGGATRRIYGVMGDAVNLAARLMSGAAPGSVLASRQIQQETAGAFAWEELPPLAVKGKAEPVAVAALVDRLAPSSAHPLEPVEELPMVGREAELELAAEKLRLARSGAGQVLGITAEAGVGKSRLVAELIRLAAAAGMACFSGECQSYGTNSPYLVWQPIWRAFFGLRPDSPADEQVAQLRTTLAAVDPALLPRLPLLGPVLDLPIAETELTAGLDQQLRKASCEALLVDCLKARARRPAEGGPPPGLLLVLEDTHWLDPLSHDLLEALGQVIAGLPVLIVLAYRPPELARLKPPRVMGLPNATTIALRELGPAETERLIRLKLQQHGLLPAGGPVPPELITRLDGHGQGNPFYVEELLNYLIDRGLDLGRPATWAAVELPTSLHSLILSRLDQLSERRRTTLKVASVIGRNFRVGWLSGYYPSLGAPDRISADMEFLCQHELTLPESREPATSYLFKHVITQVVAYESLAFATRAVLHEQFARFLEAEAEHSLPLDLLAYHYARSANLDKRREYLRRAGDAAEASYANEGALDYFGQLLDLLDDPAEQAAVLLRLATVLERVSRWPEAEARARRAHSLAAGIGDAALRARCALAVGRMLGAQGEHAAARESLDEALRDGDAAARVSALISLGQIATDQGAFPAAMEQLREALRLNAIRDDGLLSSRILSKLSWVAFMQGDFAEMRDLASAALRESQYVGSLSAQAEALRRLGMAEVSLHNYDAATEATAAALELYRTMGDREGIAASLHNMGQIYRVQRRYAESIRFCDEGLELFRELGGRRNLAMCLFTRGVVAHAQGEHAVAGRFLADGLEMARSTGDRWVIAACLGRLGMVALAAGDRAGGAEQLRAALAEATAIRVQSVTLWTLAGYAQLWLQTGRLAEAAELLGLALAHPAGGSDAPLLARPLLDTLTPMLPPDTLEAALARGRQWELEAAVAAARATG